MDLADTLHHAGPATKVAAIDWTAAHHPDQLRLIRTLAWPARRPQPMNLDLCSSCEYGTHNLCVVRLGGHGWRPAGACKCLCQYADHGLPARRPSQLFSESPLDPALPDADLDPFEPDCPVCGWQAGDGHNPEVHAAEARAGL